MLKNRPHRFTYYLIRLALLAHTCITLAYAYSFLIRYIEFYYDLVGDLNIWRSIFMILTSSFIWALVDSLAEAWNEIVKWTTIFITMAWPNFAFTRPYNYRQEFHKAIHFIAKSLERESSSCIDSIKYYLPKFLILIGVAVWNRISIAAIGNIQTIFFCVEGTLVLLFALYFAIFSRRRSSRT